MRNLLKLSCHNADIRNTLFCRPLKCRKEFVEFDELYKFNLKDAGCQLKTFKKLWNSMSYINFISKMKDVNRKPLKKIVEFDESYKFHFKGVGCQLKTFLKNCGIHFKDTGCQLKTF